MVSVRVGPVYESSTKQSSKSSTEAELIAFTDCLGEALSTKLILADISGLNVELIIYKDNQAVIHILRNGVLGGKLKTALKQVKVRVAWIKERLAAGDFQVEHCYTGILKSDGLTKPYAVVYIYLLVFFGAN